MLTGFGDGCAGRRLAARGRGGIRLGFRLPRRLPRLLPRLPVLDLLHQRRQAHLDRVHEVRRLVLLPELRPQREFVSVKVAFISQDQVLALTSSL